MICKQMFEEIIAKLKRVKCRILRTLIENTKVTKISLTILSHSSINLQCIVSLTTHHNISLSDISTYIR